LARVIAPQAIDKVYIKRHASQVYVVSRFGLRLEQRSWALSKYGEINLDNAWELSLEAKKHIDITIKKLSSYRRKPTWRELWTLEELIFLRSLALDWLSLQLPNETTRFFFVSDFMCKGPSQFEKNVWFQCPDNSFPCFSIEYNSQVQSCGSLWIDEAWESALEKNTIANTIKDSEKETKILIQMLWRYIPVDINSYCYKTKEPKSSLATKDNLAEFDEIVRKEERKQFLIANKKVATR